ncbi:ap2 domain transcription factor ap2xii-9 [Cystoisospora suis]|uniref:Ap2 domain transcription factor ap2xii-9 n=1 Tax=Cystoisospora suis TaxID=483139 RepID=A0A2C6KRA9_9APIC|nr:ap2 domain transcription factor ap2xii-9 [Cystoisospora suis]
MENALYPSSSFQDLPSRGRVYGLVQGDSLGVGSPSCPVPQCTPTASCSRMQASPTPSTFAPSSECPSRCSPSPPSSLSPLRGHNSQSPDGGHERVSKACHSPVFHEGAVGMQSQESHFPSQTSPLPLSTSPISSSSSSCIEYFSGQPQHLRHPQATSTNTTHAPYGACHNSGDASHPQYSQPWNPSMQDSSSSAPGGPGGHAGNYIPQPSPPSQGGGPAWCGRPENAGTPTPTGSSPPTYWHSPETPHVWRHGEQTTFRGTEVMSSHRPIESPFQYHPHQLPTGGPNLEGSPPQGNGEGCMNSDSMLSSFPQDLNGQQMTMSDLHARDLYRAESTPWIRETGAIQGAPPTGMSSSSSSFSSASHLLQQTPHNAVGPVYSQGHYSSLPIPSSSYSGGPQQPHQSGTTPPGTLTQQQHPHHHHPAQDYTYTCCPPPSPSSPSLPQPSSPDSSLSSTATSPPLSHPPFSHPQEVSTRAHPYATPGGTSLTQARRINSTRPRPRSSGGSSRHQQEEEEQKASSNDVSTSSKSSKKTSHQPRPPRPSKPRNPNGSQVSRPVRGLPLHQRKLYRHFARQTPRVQGLTFDHNQIRWISYWKNEQGRQIQRHFPVIRHGFLEARRLALVERNKILGWPLSADEAADAIERLKAAADPVVQQLLLHPPGSHTAAAASLLEATVGGGDGGVGSSRTAEEILSDALETVCAGSATEGRSLEGAWRKGKGEESKATGLGGAPAAAYTCHDHNDIDEKERQRGSSSTRINRGGYTHNIADVNGERDQVSSSNPHPASHTNECKGEEEMIHTSEGKMMATDAVGEGPGKVKEEASSRFSSSSPPTTWPPSSLSSHVSGGGEQNATYPGAEGYSACSDKNVLHECKKENLVLQLRETQETVGPWTASQEGESRQQQPQGCLPSPVDTQRSPPLDGMIEPSIGEIHQNGENPSHVNSSSRGVGENHSSMQSRLPYHMDDDDSSPSHTNQTDGPFPSHPPYHPKDVRGSNLGGEHLSCLSSPPYTPPHPHHGAGQQMEASHTPLRHEQDRLHGHHHHHPSIGEEKGCLPPSSSSSSPPTKDSSIVTPSPGTGYSITPPSSSSSSPFAPFPTSSSSSHSSLSLSYHLPDESVIPSSSSSSPPSTHHLTPPPVGLSQIVGKSEAKSSQTHHTKRSSSRAPRSPRLHSSNSRSSRAPRNRSKKSTNSSSSHPPETAPPPVPTQGESVRQPPLSPPSQQALIETTHNTLTDYASAPHESPLATAPAPPSIGVTTTALPPPDAFNSYGDRHHPHHSSSHSHPSSSSLLQPLSYDSSPSTHHLQPPFSSFQASSSPLPQSRTPPHLAQEETRPISQSHEEGAGKGPYMSQSHLYPSYHHTGTPYTSDSSGGLLLGHPPGCYLDQPFPQQPTQYLHPDPMQRGEKNEEEQGESEEMSREGDVLTNPSFYHSHQDLRSPPSYLGGNRGESGSEERREGQEQHMGQIEESCLRQNEERSIFQDESFSHDFLLSSLDASGLLWEQQEEILQLQELQQQAEVVVGKAASTSPSSSSSHRRRKRGDKDKEGGAAPPRSRGKEGSTVTSRSRGNPNRDRKKKGRASDSQKSQSTHPSIEPSLAFSMPPPEETDYVSPYTSDPGNKQHPPMGSLHVYSNTNPCAHEVVNPLGDLGGESNRSTCNVTETSSATGDGRGSMLSPSSSSHQENDQGENNTDLLLSSISPLLYPKQSPEDVRMTDEDEEEGEQASREGPSADPPHTGVCCLSRPLLPSGDVALPSSYEGQGLEHHPCIAPSIKEENVSSEETSSLETRPTSQNARESTAALYSLSPSRPSPCPPPPPSTSPPSSSPFSDLSTNMSYEGPTRSHCPISVSPSAVTVPSGLVLPPPASYADHLEDVEGVKRRRRSASILSKGDGDRGGNECCPPYGSHHSPALLHSTTTAGSYAPLSSSAGGLDGGRLTSTNSSCSSCCNGSRKSSHTGGCCAACVCCCPPGSLCPSASAGVATTTTTTTTTAAAADEGTYISHMNHLHHHHHHVAPPPPSHSIGKSRGVGGSDIVRRRNSGLSRGISISALSRTSSCFDISMHTSLSQANSPPSQAQENSPMLLGLPPPFTEKEERDKDNDHGGSCSSPRLLPHDGKETELWRRRRRRRPSEGNAPTTSPQGGRCTLLRSCQSDFFWLDEQSGGQDSDHQDDQSPSVSSPAERKELQTQRRRSLSDSYTSSLLSPRIGSSCPMTTITTARRIISPSHRRPSSLLPPSSLLHLHTSRLSQGSHVETGPSSRGGLSRVFGSKKRPNSNRSRPSWLLLPVSPHASTFSPLSAEGCSSASHKTRGGGRDLAHAFNSMTGSYISPRAISLSGSILPFPSPSSSSLRYSPNHQGFQTNHSPLSRDFSSRYQLPSSHPSPWLPSLPSAFSRSPRFLHHEDSSFVVRKVPRMASHDFPGETGSLHAAPFRRRSSSDLTPAAAAGGRGRRLSKNTSPPCQHASLLQSPSGTESEEYAAVLSMKAKGRSPRRHELSLGTMRDREGSDLHRVSGGRSSKAAWRGYTSRRGDSDLTSTSSSSSSSSSLGGFPSAVCTQGHGYPHSQTGQESLKCPRRSTPRSHVCTETRLVRRSHGRPEGLDHIACQVSSEVLPRSKPHIRRRLSYPVTCIPSPHMAGGKDRITSSTSSHGSLLTMKYNSSTERRRKSLQPHPHSESTSRPLKLAVLTASTGDPTDEDIGERNTSQGGLLYSPSFSMRAGKCPRLLSSVMTEEAIGHTGTRTTTREGMGGTEGLRMSSGAMSVWSPNNERSKDADVSSKCLSSKSNSTHLKSTFSISPRSAFSVTTSESLPPLLGCGGGGGGLLGGSTLTHHHIVHHSSGVFGSSTPGMNTPERRISTETYNEAVEACLPFPPPIYSSPPPPAHPPPQQQQGLLLPMSEVVVVSHRPPPSGSPGGIADHPWLVSSLLYQHENSQSQSRLGDSHRLSPLSATQQWISSCSSLPTSPGMWASSPAFSFTHTPRGASVSAAPVAFLPPMISAGGGGGVSPRLSPPPPGSPTRLLVTSTRSSSSVVVFGIPSDETATLGNSFGLTGMQPSLEEENPFSVTSATGEEARESFSSKGSMAGAV